MRREKNETHTFKGSVFCTFGDVETAKAFISNDVKEYNGSPLLKMMQLKFNFSNLFPILCEKYF